MDEAYKVEYARLYHEHWWWRARELIILENIQRVNLPQNARILDFGCGDGLFLPVLAQFGDVWGLEADASLVADDNPYRNRIETKFLAESELRRQQFDLITALDVLEHIEHDQQILLELIGMLAPGGYLLMTVPASMLLWDRHDEINHHFRRYTKASLLKIVPPDVTIQSIRYLFHGLFALKLMVSQVNRFRREPVVQHRLPPAWISRLMLNGLLAEYHGLSFLRIPFGTSLLAMLHKPMPV